MQECECVFFSPFFEEFADWLKDETKKHGIDVSFKKGIAFASLPDLEREVFWERG